MNMIRKPPVRPRMKAAPGLIVKSNEMIVRSARKIAKVIIIVRPIVRLRAPSPAVPCSLLVREPFSSQS